MSFRIEDILKTNEEVLPEAKLETQLQAWSNSDRNYYHQTSINCRNDYWQQYYTMYQQFYEINPYFPYTDSSDSAHQYETFLSNYSSGRYWPMHSISSSSILPFAYQTYSKRKSSQVRFTAVQISALEKRFRSNKYLSPEERRILSSDLKLSDRQVKTWFQNRRAKWRRCNCPSSRNEKIQDSDSDLEELLVCDEKK